MRILEHCRSIRSISGTGLSEPLIDGGDKVTIHGLGSNWAEQKAGTRFRRYSIVSFIAVG